MPIAACNGLQLYYTVHGSGEHLLLLHGFGGAAVDWAALAAEWAADFRVIVPDLRGHGRSTNPASRFRHDAAAGDIMALLDHLEVPGCNGLGVSAGGNVLLHMATRCPERVKAMVLVSATTHFPEQARPIMRSYRIELLPEEEKEKMRLRHPGGPAQIDRLFEQARAFADSYDDLNFTPHDLAKITARTLIVQGDSDAFYPVQISEEMAAAIPNAELWIVPGGGHGPIGGERWAGFVKRAGEFLRKP
ncbi:MAG TPA: alpha/beta hydrolase [Bryobacteraceae bacterium]|nr:alpha/beta hydrolase [Bryobacteraceae bacterium]